MADQLVVLGKNPLAARLMASLGLSLPPALERDSSPWRERPLEDRAVTVILGPDAQLAAPIAVTLARAGAEPGVLGDLGPFQAAGEAWGRPPHVLYGDGEDERASVLVFDASGIRDVDGLRALYTTLHLRVRGLRPSGRVIVLGRPPASITDPLHRASQRALEGFTRSLAKELGRRGSTANLIAVAHGAEDRLEPLLRWLASPRSAYISGQPFDVTGVTKSVTPCYARCLDGRVALVTGAARGIGAATARALAREGARVVVLDRPEDDDATARVASEIHGVPLLVDLTAPDAPERVAEHCRDVFGGLDLVVHNAGVTRDKTLAGMKPDQWDLVLDVNLRAVLRLHQALAPLIRDQGRIIALSSIGGIAGNLGQTNYAATKAGILGFVEALAPTLAPRGITVNAVAPGFIETRLTAAIPVATRTIARRLANLSQGGLPEDIAETIVFLASPGASGLTGSTVRVCGGNLIGA